MEGLERCATQDCKDVKKVDAYVATRDGRTRRGGDQATGGKSVITASTSVDQPEDFFTRVGPLDAQYGFQRCDFGSA
jgi:hypothetical protein